jgi:hypothetical protein
VLNFDFTFEEKDEARNTMMRIGNLFRDWNYAPWDPGLLDSDRGEQPAQDEPKNRSKIVEDTAKPEPEEPEIAEDSKDNGKKTGADKKRQESADARGDFKAILEKIDGFLKGAVESVDGKKAEGGKEGASSHLAQKAKTVKTGARPRSRRTLSGPESVGEDERE